MKESKKSTRNTKSNRRSEESIAGSVGRWAQDNPDKSRKVRLASQSGHETSGSQRKGDKGVD